MALATKNYVVGRGKVYFNKFLPDTETPTGERYLGNTPSLNETAAYQELPHYSSDEGLRELDDSATLQVDDTLNFTCDNISIENVAMWFGRDDPTSETTAATVGATESILDVKLGYFYQLGVSGTVPDGVGTIANLVIAGPNTKATGSITVGGQPVAAETVTINGQVVTFVASGATGFQVNIGATTADTAANLRTLINANPAVFNVTAGGTGNTVSLTAIAGGVGGNAITLAEAVAAAAFTVSGATLTGGLDGPTIAATGNYEADLAHGRVHILDDAIAVTPGDDLTATYDTVLETRSVVVRASEPAEGSLRFIADNPKGTDKDRFWPRVKLVPSGETALKGETWQTLTFTGTVLSPSDGRKRVYVREKVA